MMRRRLFSLLLAVLLVAGALPMAALAADSGDCSAAGDGSLTWSVDNGVLTISGSGKIAQYDPFGNTAPWTSLNPTKAVIKADVTITDTYSWGGLFWPCESLTSFEVEDGNSTFFAYDDCLYANVREMVADGMDPDTGAVIWKPTGKTNQTLVAIPVAKAGALDIKEGTKDALGYSSFGILQPYKNLTSIHFPSTWWVYEGLDGNQWSSFESDHASVVLRTNSPLTSFTISENHPNTKSVNGSLYMKNGKALVLAPSVIPNNEFTVVDGTQRISSVAFWNFAMLYNENGGAPLKLTIPASVTEISAQFPKNGVEIIGEPGSAAETFAKEFNHKFTPISSIEPPEPPKPTVGGFTDVFEGDFYDKAVLWAVDQGITAGKGSSDTFKPGDACTRAEIVTFLWRAKGQPAASGKTFTDVPAGSYYEQAVKWAYENGITIGTDDTHFSPNTPCTRAQAMTLMWRAAGKPSGSGSSFSDVPSGQYYTEAVQWAVSRGITSGTSDTTFSPAQSCQRGQIVTFLYRDAVK